LIWEDSTFESYQADVVDFVAACGSISHLNLQGIGKPERSVKVDRLQEICEQLFAVRQSAVLATKKSGEIQAKNRFDINS